MRPRHFFTVKSADNGVFAPHNRVFEATPEKPIVASSETKSID
jgi:hypothetical protein